MARDYTPNTVLGTVASSSRPLQYDIVLTKAGDAPYCKYRETGAPCESWKFQHIAPRERTCKHMAQWAARTLTSDDATPTQKHWAGVVLARHSARKEAARAAKVLARERKGNAEAMMDLLMALASASALS